MTEREVADELDRLGKALRGENILHRELWKVAARSLREVQDRREMVKRVAELARTHPYKGELPQ